MCKKRNGSGSFHRQSASETAALVVGDNESNPAEATGTLARSIDGGKTWTAALGLTGFRSAVVYVNQRKLWVASGTAGTDVSSDGGISWNNIGPGYNAMSFSKGGAGWAVGANGSIAGFH